MQREDLKQLDIPDEPGVYFFKKGKTVLYIGKATSLRDRVRSYFASDLLDARAPTIVQMVAQSDTLEWQQTDSVLEALLLEATLIKRYQPSANVDEKDNKSFNYVVVTKEDFPRVLVVRGRELYQNWSDTKIKNLFGPFPHGLQLREAMKIIRKIFPYRDAKCVPCGTGKNKKCRPCFNRQIRLCPGVCTGEISKTEYAKVIRDICELFSGNFKGFKRRLAKEMQELSKAEKFEEAELRRRQVSALEHIRDVSLIKDERRVAPGGAVRANSTRIESYDVAHTAGTETVAVMTVVEEGEAQKSDYRKFRIHSATNDDTAALREALTRRLNHPEWPLPRVFVVDGGKGQVNAARKILDDVGIDAPVVGVVKNEFHKPERLIGDEAVIALFEKDILLSNSEAHRFGITWHRKRLGKRLI